MRDLGSARVTLYWIPLGAGGAVIVRISGRIYEAMQAAIRRRQPLDLYHTALELHVDGNRYIIENGWPSPDNNVSARGVVVVGPVWARWLGRFRAFRYEVRCWQGGSIPDVGEAVAARTLTTDSEAAKRLLDRAVSVPAETWGRDVRNLGEMWNSNSVISYLLTVAGLPAEEYSPPTDGSVPGWRTGIALARATTASGEREGTSVTRRGTLVPRDRTGVSDRVGE